MLKWLLALAVIWAAWRLLRPTRKPSVTAAPTLGQREAARLLGVAPDADAQAIRDAHRHKVAEAHPDRGGSAELTRELNAARDLLLRELR